MNRRLRSLLSAAVAAAFLLAASPSRAAEPADDIGTPEKAIKKFQQAVEKAPTDSESWYNLALAFYKAKKYPDAVTAASKAAELNSAGAEPQRLLGAIASKTGKHGDAITAFGKAKELETAGGAPATSETVLGLAGAYYESGRLDEAIDAFKEGWKLLKDAKGDLSAVNNQLGAAYLKKGDSAQAIKWFERNIELAPDSPATYYNLGQTYRKLGAGGASEMWPKSAEMFGKAADMMPNDAVAQFFAGEAMLIAGRKGDAVKYLDRYLAGDPGGKKAIAKFGPAGKTEVYDAAVEYKAEATK